MEHLPLIDRLESDGLAFAGLLSGVSKQQARWKPEPGRWCLTQVAAHLYDEEWEDFKPRLVGVLSEDNFVPAFLDDPERRSAERKYSEWSLGETLSKFEDERRRSVEYLRSLQSPDWQRSFVIPDVMELSAGEILSAWVAHDLVHIRQITALLFHFLEERSKPYNVEYAGIFDVPMR